MSGVEPPPPAPQARAAPGRGRSAEDYVEVHDEPVHRRRLVNRFVYVYRVDIAPGAATLWHRHRADTMYFSLADARCREDVAAREPVLTEVACEAVVSRPHRAKPLVHKVTNLGETGFCMIGAEALAPPPCARPRPLALPGHELTLQTPRFRVYRVRVGPGTERFSYAGCCGLVVALAAKRIAPGEVQESGSGGVQLERGGVFWLRPSSVLHFPDGFDGYFCEWR